MLHEVATNSGCPHIWQLKLLFVFVFCINLVFVFCRNLVFGQAHRLAEEGQQWIGPLRQTFCKRKPQMDVSNRAV